MHATSCVIEVLRTTRKYIVTNLALNVPRLCEYLQEKYGESFNAANRIRILEEEECAQFWLYFAPGLSLDPMKRINIPLPDGKPLAVLDFSPRYQAMKQAYEVWKDSSAPDFSGYSEENFQKLLQPQWSGGVAYFIDECHEFFNARRWASTGNDCLHYLTQHRKLGDDVFFITQAVANCDKQLRSVTQEFIYLRNHNKEKLPIFGGLFRSFPVFTRSTYSEPMTGMPGQLAMETRTFRLDVPGLCSCYDTARGVGIQGAGADTDEKKKGLPISVLFVFGLVLVAFFWWGTSAFANSFRSDPAPEIVSTNSPATNNPGIVKQISNSVGNVVAGGVGQGFAIEEKTEKIEPVLTSQNREKPDVFLSGIMVIPQGGGRKSIQVFLTDGRVYTEKDKELEKLSEKSATIAGVEYFYRPPVLHFENGIRRALF